MPTSDMIFLAIVIGSLTLFGLVLGWASYQDTKSRRKPGG